MAGTRGERGAKLDPRLKPLVKELRLVLLEKGVDQKAVEKKLGWSAGYLSQLLNGHVDLKIIQLYDVLEKIGTNPIAFFSRLSGRDVDVRDLYARLTALEQQAANAETAAEAEEIVKRRPSQPTPPSPPKQPEAHRRPPRKGGP